MDAMEQARTTLDAAAALELVETLLWYSQQELEQALSIIAAVRAMVGEGQNAEVIQ